jgi:hypothetical protein
VSQFVHSPYKEHLEAFYRILRYLKGLFFKKTSEGNVSISLMQIGQVQPQTKDQPLDIVIGRSKKQGVIARSNAETEFRAISQYL